MTRTPDDQRKGHAEGLAGADGIPEALRRGVLSDDIKAKDADIHLYLVRSGGKAVLAVDWNVTTSTGKRIITRRRQYATIKSFVEALKYRLEV